jgi:NitT/TauT family transport system permease protein
MRSGYSQRVASLALSAVAWELVARGLRSPILPPCSTVLAALVTLVREGQVFGNLAASLSALVAGFGLAVLVGVPTGAVMGSSPRVARALDPYLSAGLASPMLIYVPVLVTIGGASRFTQVATIFLYAVFAITSYTLTGVRSVSPSLLEMARAFGASRRQVFWQVAWPGTRPMMMTGLRVAMALAVKGMVNGEMLIASTGIGALARTYGGRFDTARVLALLLVIVAVALSATGTLRALERHAWPQAERA